MDNELVPIEGEVMLGAIPLRPQEVVQRAKDIATVLADIVNQRKLYKVISGRKYVQVEGWNTLGAMLGILPVERETKKVENGYEAYVDLIRAKDGMKVGGASAICTFDEKNWHDRDEYAVRSMAITRATGKAFRIGFSWIMQLAGYEVTPAEEIPAEPEPPPQKTKKVWQQEQINALVAAEFAQNDFAAKGMLGLSNLPETASVDLILEWGKRYRSQRPDPKAKDAVSALDAAKFANDWYTSYKEKI